MLCVTRCDKLILKDFKGSGIVLL